MLVFRPGDGNETSGAYKVAIQTASAPAPPAPAARAWQTRPTPQSTRWPWVVMCSKTAGTPDLILIGTGTERPLRSGRSVHR